uniref:Large T antigen n=1 Tax=BK polyomavirus TaxID=1891762 RepID=Q068Y2_POVBK|nr:large T [Betapolyomavirus hominis]
MDKVLNREESMELMDLLGLERAAWGNLPLMRKAYLRKCKEFHPDKGGDEDKMKRMNTLYKKMEQDVKVAHQPDFGTWSSSEVPTYGTEEWESWWSSFNEKWDEDLFCHEDMFASDEEATADSQHSTPPKKKRKVEDPKDFPSDLHQFLSQAVFSNRTLACFAVYTTKEKAQILYKKLMEKYSVTFISRHMCAGHNIIFFLTPHRHRVSAINNFCQKLCTFSFLICKGVNKEYLLYSALTRDPYHTIEESIQGGLKEHDFSPEEPEETKQVSWKLITEYAVETKCEDVFLLLGMYLEFQYNVEECKKCQKKDQPYHFKYHEKHFANATIFAESKNQKSICQQAVDTVLAKKRVDSLHMTREEMLTERFNHILDKMDLIFGAHGNAVLEQYMAGVAWLHCLLPKMDSVIFDFLHCIVFNVPKRRYWLFKGPIDSGKTTLAAGLLDLCGGKALNVNLPMERLTFELGVAIDQYMVVFEDVKGTGAESKDLPSGHGINNLDSLRDYLDGSVKVNLEKKHLNKRTQIFPPGLVTMNEYPVPKTLQARFVRQIDFRPKIYLRKSLQNSEFLLEKRILQSGMTLLLLLIWFRPVADFATDIQSRIVEWKERLDSEISMYTFSRMKYNICMGKCILDITREEDSETEDSGHGSSTESQSQCSSQVSDTSAPAEDSQRSDPHSQELHLCKGFQCFKRPKTPPPK